MNIIGTRINTTTERFGKIIREDCVFVDKSLLIQEFIEDANDALLITRPRRFGKSLNLSMLQHFFAKEVRGEATAGLFDGLAIAQVNQGQMLQQHQGQYPVILMNFKNINTSSYEGAIKQFRGLISSLYEDYRILLNSSKLEEYEKKQFKSFLHSENQSLRDAYLQEAIYYLTKLLFKIYRQRVVILIDEYDTPIHSGYQHGYLEEISQFMRGLLGQILKGNDFLHKALMIGILYISTSEMLSGLNNLKVHTLFSKEYSAHFGFTEEEVIQLLQLSHTESQLEAVRPFYNGYKIGSHKLYNPWAMMHYCRKKSLECYWVMTSNDALLRKVLLNSTPSIQADFAQLMQGHTVLGGVNLNLRYDDLMEQEHALWTLLVFCGYLTITGYTLPEFGNEYRCDLKIPNREILGLYRHIFVQPLQERCGSLTAYDTFLKQLTQGDVPGFTYKLGSYLASALSIRDVHGQPAERFYHGFYLGLIASLRDTHHISSHRESGQGLYDVMLIPKSSHDTRGMIIEFKQGTPQKLQSQALIALKQIEQLQYDQEFHHFPHIQNVLKVGLAFSEKAVMSAFHETHLPTQNTTPTQLSQTFKLHIA